MVEPISPIRRSTMGQRASRGSRSCNPPCARVTISRNSITHSPRMVIAWYRGMSSVTNLMMVSLQVKPIIDRVISPAPRRLSPGCNGSGLTEAGRTRRIGDISGVLMGAPSGCSPQA